METNYWYIFLASASGTAVITFILKTLDRVVDEWRAKVGDSRKAKQELADEIVKICSEGASHHHTTLPRDQEHIKYVAYKAKYFNTKIYEDILAYLRTWVEHATLCDKNRKTANDQNRIRNTYIECNSLHSGLLQHSVKLK